MVSSLHGRALPKDDSDLFKAKPTTLIVLLSRLLVRYSSTQPH
jgi:hypothetical protein